MLEFHRDLCLQSISCSADLSFRYADEGKVVAKFDFALLAFVAKQVCVAVLFGIYGPTITKKVIFFSLISMKIRII